METASASRGATPKTTPTTTPIDSAMTSPVRFMGADPTTLYSESLPGACFAAGKNPIDKTAGNASRGEHLALAHQRVFGIAAIAGEIEAITQRQCQHAAERRIDEARAPSETFRKRDNKQRRHH